MALRRCEGKTPKDGNYLTEDEALQYQWNLIWNWEEQKRIFPIRIGFGISGLSCGFAGMYFNNYFRQKLKLKNFGKMSSYIPNVILPTLGGSFFHWQLVTSDILLHKTECPLCVEIRAVAIQTVFGLIYPIILSTLAGIVNANNYLTYNVPSLRYPGQVLKLLWKFTKPLSTTIPIVFALQAISASIITVQEGKTLQYIEKELIKQELKKNQ
uniref:Putative conserved plasma membrane protein n=1 Tax=Xenopsylla cheopis TaxID=163159 RepID=A0A6M2DRY1_XENCH